MKDIDVYQIFVEMNVFRNALSDIWLFLVITKSYHEGMSISKEKES